MATFKKVLESAPGRKQTFIDETNLTGKIVIHDEEDCEPYIEAAKVLSDKEPGKNFRHAAIVPHFVYAQALRQKWTPKDWKKWANDSDNKMFRTWPGQL